MSIDRAQRRYAPCLEPLCSGEAVKNGRCEQHQTAWEGSNRKRRLPPDWEARRQMVFNRDGRVCYACGAVATEVDHQRAGDDHALANLAPICYSCHKTKSSLEGNAAKYGGVVVWDARRKEWGIETNAPKR